MTSCFLLLKIQSNTHADTCIKYGFLNIILALSFACLTHCVICRTKQSYKVFVMIPHLD